MGTRLVNYVDMIVLTGSYFHTLSCIIIDMLLTEGNVDIMINQCMQSHLTKVNATVYMQCSYIFYDDHDQAVRQAISYRHQNSLHFRGYALLGSFHCKSTGQQARPVFTGT